MISMNNTVSPKTCLNCLGVHQQQSGSPSLL